MNVLVNHPDVGSVWLDNAYFVEIPDEDHLYVMGSTWDDHGVGSPLYPDDWRGEPAWMNFPATCVRRFSFEEYRPDACMTVPYEERQCFNGVAA